MKTIENNTIIQRNDSRFVATELGDELVMMDVESGSYIRLNKTARVIWECLKKPIKVETLIKQLTNNYLIEEEQCKIEVIEFLNKIKNLTTF
jgi:hypothetical protein